MKKLFTYLLLLLASSLLGCTQPYDDTEVRKDIENLKDRVTALEKLCKEMNANINAMAAILEALETHDYITSVTPITRDGETVGYTITFAKGEPITIYNGEDGKDGVDGEDGADGKDGTDGYTPIIGVAQDSDGIAYLLEMSMSFRPGRQHTITVTLNTSPEQEKIEIEIEGDVEDWQ